MKQMVVVIGLDKEDDAKALSLYIMNLVNDKGYVVNNISVDEKEIFDGGSFNEKKVNIKFIKIQKILCCIK